jgi:hypothetical protein
MPYIPKNRIQQNLYTAGGEFYIPEVDSNYIGFYYKLYDGKLYTGKNPDDKPNYNLIPIQEDSNLNSLTPTSISFSQDFETYKYGKLKKIDLNAKITPPQLFYTLPTKSDYQLGEFRRLFCKKRNEFIYMEISKTDYNKLVKKDPTINFKMWLPFNIPWTLTGTEQNVFNTNRNIVMLKEKNEKLFGLGRYLREDYLRYYRS